MTDRPLVRLLAMSDSNAHWETLLINALGAAALEEIDLPHVIVCRERGSDNVSYLGPFPDGLAALVAAEKEADRATRDAQGPAMAFSVAALFAFE